MKREPRPPLPRLDYLDARELHDLLIGERRWQLGHWPFTATNSRIRKIEAEMRARGIEVPHDR